MDFSIVDREMTEAVEQGVFPGAVVLVNRAGTVVYRRAFGWRSLDPERASLSEETVFDLASLTKPLATTLAIMLLVREKKLRLDDRVARFFPNFSVHGKSAITFRHLLAHSSGLPAWRPYYRDILDQEAKGRKVGFVGTDSAKEFVYTQLQREKLEAAPGQQAVYSDLGFMLLGATVETVSSLKLDQYCWNKIFRPLRLQSTAFINLENLRRGRFQPLLEKFAPTERCAWRKRVLCAEVHDDNAYAMGGVAGHAGLFSTADDLDRLIRSLIACYHGESSFLPSVLMREFWTRDNNVPGSSWALGWDTPSLADSSAGGRFSPTSVGHLGFTGTSLWVDLERHVHVIVLSNRVHPSRENEKIRDFRPVLHNAIMQAVLGDSSSRQ